MRRRELRQRVRIRIIVGIPAALALVAAAAVPASANGAVCTSQGRWHPILVTYGNVVLHIQQPEGTDVATEDIGSNAAP